MKKVVFILVSVVVFCCNQQQEISADSVTGLAELPPNATKEPYESNPNLIKVTIPGSGDAYIVGDYLNGKRSGSWTEFHTNGVLKSVTSYIDGVKQGTHITSDDRGQVEVIASYHNGELDGDWKQYSRTRVKEERTYINGKLEGTVRIYYPTGKIMEEGLYTNGVRDGISRWYDQEGNVTIEYEYKNGELVNK